MGFSSSVYEFWTRAALTKRDLCPAKCVNNRRSSWTEYIQCSDAIWLRFTLDLHPGQIPIGIDFEPRHFPPIWIWQGKAERLQHPWHLHKGRIHLAIYTDVFCRAQWLWWTLTGCKMDRWNGLLKSSSEQRQELWETGRGLWKEQDRHSWAAFPEAYLA